jgi:alcohol dehydrogenase class IV
MINKQVFEFPIKYLNQVPFGRIAIGWGAHETIAEECKAVNIKKALIVTTGLKGTGIVDEVDHLLTTQGVATAIYDGVTSNPKDYQVMEAYKVFKEAECDGVVSVGGGSSHDCGKAVRAVATNDGKDVIELIGSDENWMEEIDKLKPIAIPQICINTTAGTGAESSFSAAISNTKLRLKQVLVAPGSSPALAIIDPLLVRLVPRTYAAWTGFDALAHGFEAFVSRIQVPHSKGIMLYLMKIIAENLREFVHNRMNPVACENMCWAGVGLVHGIGHPMGGVTDGHHGRINAALTIPIERGNVAACPERFIEMAQAMGADTRGMTKLQAANKWFDEIESLMADLNIQTGHLSEQFGLQKKDIAYIMDDVSADSFVSQGNPADIDFKETQTLLEELL